MNQIEMPNDSGWGLRRKQYLERRGGYIQFDDAYDCDGFDEHGGVESDDVTEL